VEGEQVRACNPGAGLGCALTHFIQPLKTRFQQKFIQNMPKHANFGKEL